MKVLIIGSRGFIGSHLTSYFHATQKEEVFTCDVVTDYAARNYFLIDPSNADFEEIFREQPFDLCINCSGAASVADSIRHPLRDYYLNTKQVFNILNSIRLFCPEARFINLSSAAVYGNPQTLPIKETHNPHPVSPYGWHKLQSELICREFHEAYGLKTCYTRIFSAFGPGLKKQLFWDWTQKARHSGELILYGTGNESRDFIYIDDLVKAIHLISKHAAFSGEAINVANGQEVFIKEAAAAFASASPTPLTYHFDNQVRTGDPLNWVANIDHLVSFGYQQSVPFNEGLQRYITWINELE